MKFVLTGIFILCLSCFPIWAQNNNSIPEDIATFRDSIRHYRKSKDTINTYLWSQKLYAFATSNQNRQYLAWYHFDEANNLFDLGDKNDLSTVFFHLDKSLEITQNLGFVDHRLLYVIYSNYSYFIDSKNPKKSDEYLWKSYEHSQYLDDPAEKATTAYLIGVEFINIGNFKQAKDYIEEALEIDYMQSDSLGISHDLGLIANLTWKLGEFEEAKKIYREALTYLNPDTNNQDEDQYLTLRLALADLLISNNQPDEAKNLLLQTEKGIIAYKNKKLQLRFEIHLAQANFNLGLKEIALSGLKEVALESEHGFKREYIRANIWLGKFEESSKSLEYLLVARNSAKESGIEEYLSRIYPIIEKKIRKFGSPQQRLEFYDEYVVHLNLQLNKNIESTINSYDQSINFYKEKLENLQLQFENVNVQQMLTLQKMRTNLFLGISILLLLLGSIIYFKYQQKKEVAKIAHQAQIISLKERLTKLLYEGKIEINVPSMEKFNDLVVTPLTQKEYEILLDLVKKKTNKIIAEEHFISLNTVKFHLKNIYSKLDVPNKKYILEKVSRLNKN